MKYPISIFLFISMFFVCSCAGLGGFPLYSGSYGSQAASRLTPVESPATGLYGYVNDLGMWVIQPFHHAKHDQHHCHNHDNDIHPKIFICFKRKEFFDCHTLCC